MDKNNLFERGDQEPRYLETYQSQFHSRRLKKWVPVTINLVRELGAGNFVTAYEAVIEFDSNGRKKKRRFVVKRPLKEFFKEPSYDLEHGYENSGEEPAIAVCSSITKGHSIAKQAGLKVFSTVEYFYGDYGPEIVETLGFDDEWICIGDKGNSSYVESFDRVPLPLIENFDSLLAELLNQALSGFVAGIYIGSDAYLFLVHRAENKVDFVVGDVGFLDQDREYKKSEDTLFYNLDHVAVALQNFLEKNVCEEKRNEYAEKISQSIVKIKKTDVLKRKLIDKALRVKDFLRDILSLL